MQFNIQEATPGTVNLEVLIDEEQFSKAKADVMDMIARSTQLPGFRKGKAPRSMVERSVDPKAVRSRAIDKLLPDAYEAALKDSGLEPITDPDVKVTSEPDSLDLRFVIVVHKRPEVTVGNLEGLELTRYETTVTDEDVDLQAKTIMEQNPEYISIPDATIELNDQVVLTFIVVKDGEEIEDTRVPEMRVMVGSYHQVPAIDDDLVGMKIGEVKDVEVAYPSDFKTEEFQGQTVIWRIEITDVLRPTVHELTDEFVAEHMQMDSVQALKDRIRKDMEKRATELDESAIRTQIMGKLMETSTVVFPHILVDQEMETRKDRLRRTLQRSRKSIEEFAASQGGTPEMLLQEMYAWAEQDLREYLLLHHVAADLKVEVTDEQVEALIEQEDLAEGKRPAIIEIDKKNETRRNGASFDLMQKAVMDHIVSKAKVTVTNQGFAAIAGNLESEAE